jgi:hypothetical protein
MCLEMLIGAGLSAAGGSMARGEADRNATREVKARNRELGVLNNKADAATGANQTVLGDTIRAIDPAMLGRSQNTRVAAAESNLPGAMEDIPMSANAPQVAQAEYAKRMQEAIAKSKTTAGNLGRLAGFDQQQFDIGMGTNAAQQDIGFNNAPVQGQARIMPHLSDFRAIEAYRPSSGIGQMMQAMGSVMGGMPMGPGAMPGGMPMTAPTAGMPHAARIGF